MDLTPVTAPLEVSSLRAWYSAAIAEFLQSSTEYIVGKLVRANGQFAILPTQTAAWEDQIQFLQSSLKGLTGKLLLEYNIPRMGRRIDTVLVIGPVVFVVEFKVGEEEYDRAAMDQVWDYALDLKNFHEASHDVPIVPILVATNAKEPGSPRICADEDSVFRPIQTNLDGFREAINLALQTIKGKAIDDVQWTQGSYRPTPTIIEAARALYAHHSVEAIARFDAGARNLQITSRRVEELVDEARKSKRKIICFVTGVPGAGKTLVGLNIATRHQKERDLTHAVFLSGNGPLVAVLREALIRDEYDRRRNAGERIRKGKIGERVKAFIQNVHNFRDEGIIDKKAPADHVVIFDEAQRAWDLTQTAKFMRQKKKRSGFSQSEPEFLISYMDRHRDWAAIICLVGGGQEINIGEAGIKEWIESINRKFSEWHMYISSNLVDSEYAAGKSLDIVRGRKNTYRDDSLHLAVSMRSFRAENVSAFVKALLDCEKQRAREAFSKLAHRYPIKITRDLEAAKQWIRSQARGSERFGVVASSKAQRLKPHAIDIRVKVNPVHWFLNDMTDTRSSYYLEDVATEFHVQGLELDWACVTWDGDLRFAGSGWSYHDFRGSQWCRVAKVEKQNYLRNAYRVLLTRARQGMVVFVPAGDSADPTRTPSFYDFTFEYLVQIGIPVLEA